MTEWDIRRAAVGQKRIQIILCDDDPAFVKELQAEVVRSVSKLNAKADITTGCGLADLTSEQLAACDMIFLDIDFADDGYNGIDIARTLREVNRRALIFFVTNFIDYAPVGYEVQAFRYILKRDLRDVLERYMMQALEKLAEGREALRLWNKDETVHIPLNQIAYLEVMDHSVSIHAGEQSYGLYATLTALEERMAPHGFLRIHKSFLVNMRHICKFRSRECLLKDGTVLAVSERNYGRQKQKYLLWKGLK